MRNTDQKLRKKKKTNTHMHALVYSATHFKQKLEQIFFRNLDKPKTKKFCIAKTQRQNRQFLSVMQHISPKHFQNNASSSMQLVKKFLAKAKLNKLIVKHKLMYETGP